MNRPAFAVRAAVSAAEFAGHIGYVPLAALADDDGGPHAAPAAA